MVRKVAGVAQEIAKCSTRSMIDRATGLGGMGWVDHTQDMLESSKTSGETSSQAATLKVRKLGGNVVRFNYYYYYYFIIQ